MKDMNADGYTTEDGGKIGKVMMEMKNMMTYRRSWWSNRTHGANCPRKSINSRSTLKY